MSLRSLVEINHDYTHRMDEVLPVLRRYLSGGSRRDAEELERFGIRVIGMRHHADKFIVQGEPDGFPVRHLAAPASDTTGRDFAEQNETRAVIPTHGGGE